MSTSPRNRDPDSGKVRDLVWCRSPGSVVAWAPAKVNLTLEVTGKRPDGFHAIETLMLAVELFDTLELESSGDANITLSCQPEGLPTDRRNLVYKAAELMQSRWAPDRGVRIRLSKRIPSEAGLGGGSSDAATTLMALNELWELQKSRADLTGLAAEIGSDVAFFLSVPAGFCTGRGEIVEPETVGRPVDLVIVKPVVGLSTAAVYRKVAVPSTVVDSRSARSALRAGDVEALGKRLWNRLQEPAFAVEPAVEALYRRMLQTNPLGCQLSGSGSAVFALGRDRHDAERIAAEIRANGVNSDTNTSERVYVVRSWPSFLTQETQGSASSLATSRVAPAE